MPQIILKSSGQPVADFSMSGSVVTVAGVEVDCAARQQDVAVLVEIRNNGGVAAEGGSGAYLAQIEIPARRYEEVAVPVEEGHGDEGDGVAVDAQRQPLPLDPGAVVVTLWPTA